jgi:hypothetical protein
MTKEKLMNNIFQYGVLTAIVALAVPGGAFAQDTGGVIDSVLSNMTNMPHLVSAVAYIGGGVLGISGALKLKAHAEKPEQEKIAPGVARLLAGGALIALPALLSTSNETTGIMGTIVYNSLETVN